MKTSRPTLVEARKPSASPPEVRLHLHRLARLAATLPAAGLRFGVFEGLGFRDV